jgi:hypothetical protein
VEVVVAVVLTQLEQTVGSGTGGNGGARKTKFNYRNKSRTLLCWWWGRWDTSCLIAVCTAGAGVQVVVDRAVLFHRQREMVGHLELLILVVGAAAAVKFC